MYKKFLYFIFKIPVQVSSFSVNISMTFPIPLPGILRFRSNEGDCVIAGAIAGARGAEATAGALTAEVVPAWARLMAAARCRCSHAVVPLLQVEFQWWKVWEFFFFRWHRDMLSVSRCTRVEGCPL